MQQHMFSKIDANGDGKQDKDELAEMVAKGPQGGPSVDDILSKLDSDGDGAPSARANLRLQVHQRSKCREQDFLP